MDAPNFVSSVYEGDGFYISQIKNPQLAIFSYYLQSEGQAALIDPTYDIAFLKNLANTRGSSIKKLILTHYHADFISGHTQIETKVIIGKGGKKTTNQFEVEEVEDNQIITLGAVKILAIHTPGHTLESTCFLLHDKNGKQVCLFTGDTVFLGDVGRPDLAVNSGLTKEDLAALLFSSIQKLKDYPNDIKIYPAHGAGSSCGKAIGAGNFSTLGQQKNKNYGFTITDKDEFIKQISNISPAPKYFSYDASINQEGPKSYDDSFKNVNVPLSVEEFRQIALKSEIIDTRKSVGKGIIKGAYWLPKHGAITAWLSNIISPQKPFIIFCEKGEFEELANRFFRIGYFKILGFNNFSIQDWKEPLNSPKLVGFKEFKQLQNSTHLDVRNIPEYQTLGKADNSIILPLPELPNRIDELKDKSNLVISCRSGLRARVAYSILAKAGIQSTVFIESYDKFAENGIKIVPYAS